jgi:hypothetical protein
MITAPNIEVRRSINSKQYRAVIPAPLQRHQGPINYPLIHMICPAKDQENLTPNNVNETTPRRSDRAVRLLTASRLYLNSLSNATKNWRQINPHLNDYHSDPMENSSSFCIPDITNWWHQQKETCLKYINLSNVSSDIFSIIPHCVRVEGNFSLGPDAIGWRQSKTTGETLHEKVVVRQFARANNGISAGTDRELDTQ